MKEGLWAKMRGLFSGLLSGVATLTALHVHASRGAHVADKTPQYQLLPSLREQAEIVDAWTEERKDLIPGLLRKYGVDAWLVRLSRHQRLSAQTYPTGLT